MAYVEREQSNILINSVLKIVLIVCPLLISTIASAEVNDTSMADVEIYGKASNLLRITPSHSFDIKIHNHSKTTCEVDNAGLKDLLKRVLLRHVNYEIAEGSAAQFTLHFEFFGNRDVHNHCMFGYSLGIERNNMRNDPDGERLGGKYDYDNSYPLLKIMGMLHVDEPALDKRLKEELKLAADKIFLTLEDVQNDLRN